MNKLLFASLLTAAVVFGATITPDDKPAPTKTKKFGGSHGDDTPTAKTKKGGKKGVNKAGKQPPAKRPESALPAK